MFKIAKRDVADVNPHIYMEAAEDLEVGEALIVSAGQLTKAGTTDEVTHICVGEKNDIDQYPAIAVHPYNYFETKTAETIAASAIGTAVTLDSDALSVTSTTGGAFVIDETDEATESTVVGHFISL